MAQITAGSASTTGSTVRGYKRAAPGVVNLSARMRDRIFDNIVDFIHVTIQTHDLAATEKFYTEVLQMKIGPRPDLGVPGLWLDMKGTQVHILAGEAALDGDGHFTPGSGALDHVALSASDYDVMKKTVQEFGCDYRENNISDFNLWQLFVKDPSDVMYELNFFVSEEPEGAVGPDSANQYIPGKF